MSDASTLFELLAADARRRVLCTLCDAETVDVPDGLRRRRPAEAASPSADRTADVQLYHTHLPKLEAEGVISWDRDAETVSRGPTFAEFEPAVRLLAANAHLLPGASF